MFLRKRNDFAGSSAENNAENLLMIKKEIQDSDAVILGAGAGLSASAGFTYSGGRFEQYFEDFREKYGFSDMYSGGFYPYETMEEYWAYWSRYIYINRYMDTPKSVYDRLYKLVKDKDYFVLTTNVDHCFQKAGFDKHRLFYTQGDYGLFQCSEPCHPETYDNEEIIKKMVLSQGFEIKDGRLVNPTDKKVQMSVPSELVPHCPKCGKLMTMNLRADDTFTEDEGWHRAAERYQIFLQRHKNLKTVFIELGVGYNTPGIIKYPFWQMTDAWPKAKYICLNAGDAAVPGTIKKKSICINGDIGEILREEK